MLNKNDIKVFAVTMSSMLSLQIPPSPSGKVHSKFKNGLNVQFGEILIYIGSIQTHLSAFGINVSPADLEKLLAVVSVGELVIRKGEKLVFYSTFGMLELDYSNTEYVELKIPEINCEIEQITNTGLYKHLSAMDLATKTGLPQDEQTKKYLDLLKNADKNNDENNLRIIKFFAGRGPGLTPSGDDLLLGFTLSLLTFTDFQNWVDNLAQIINEHTTTDISVAYMRSLLKGYVSSSCGRLVRMLDESDSKQIADSVKDVAAFGHKSGVDTLYGFLLGLQYLSKK